MMNLSSEPMLVVDLETSGINPFKNEVLAVGLVPLSGGDPLQIFVRPDKIEWSEFARSNFEKFAVSWEAEAISPSLACIAIERYLASTFSGKRVTPIGHNIGFDVAFLRKLAHLGGRDELAMLSHRAIDTHTLLHILYLQGKLPKAALSSDGAFRYFNIAPPDSARHTAIGDAIATKELVLRLMDMFGVSR